MLQDVQTIQTDPVVELWTRYGQSRTEALRDRLVLYYTPLVKQVVSKWFSTLPNHVSRDDLTSSGIIGLIKAVERFDPDKGYKFETFGYHRIRGAILDELRTYDIMPRRLRIKAREVQKAIEALEGELGRHPTEFEIADKLSLGFEAYHELVSQLNPIRFFPITDALDDNGEWKLYKNLTAALEGSDDIEGLAEKQELKNVLLGAVQNLPKSERMVIALYYYEELTMKEIGVVLKVSESRVSQIHTQAVLRLRNALERSEA
jgi:RNA polymerase sigma factor FliA